jgi:protease IV
VLKFVLRIFAVIGFLTSLVFLIALGMGVYKQNTMLSEPQSVILDIDFNQSIVEQSESSPFDLAIQEETPSSLIDILHAIDKAKDDPHVKGIFARFGTAMPSLNQAQEIRAALARFRSSNKFTYAYGASYGDFGLGNRAYFLACAFENIWLQPIGSVGLTGLALQSPFAKEALSKIGITADFMRREEYKSFSEMTTRDEFSLPVRANMQSLLDSLDEQETDGIAESRKWNRDRVKRLMDSGPYTDEEAIKAGLVTHIGYEDELLDEIDHKAGKDTKHVDIESYLSFRDHGLTEKPKAKVALIFGTGLIMDRAIGRSDVGGEHIMAANDIVEAINDAIEDKDIKAILFRVDSPGGSPDASETIRRAIIHAQNKGKPVFVSMGETAASGGYWIAMNADQIIAEPGTITGSIGVLAGKFVLGGLMEKLGVHWDTLKTADEAGLWSMMNEFTPVQRARVNVLLDRTYAAFVKNVSDARKIPMEKMPDIAKGRVWTGAQAVKIGLVDQLGGYDVTLKAIRKKLGLDEKQVVALEQFPPPETPVERLLKLLHGLGTDGVLVRTALAQWQSFSAVVAPMLNDIVRVNPVLARMPSLTDGLRF